MSRRRLVHLVGALVATAALSAPAAYGFGAGGVLPNRDYAPHAVISQDGRYFAFYTDATNLSSDDTDTVSDVYVRDTLTGNTVLASRADGPAGAKGNGQSGFVPIPGDGSTSRGLDISEDGRHVAFVSSANNLDPADTDGSTDVFVRDIQATTTRLVSRATGAGGTKGSGPSTYPSVSGDGRFIAFASQAPNLSPADTDALQDVFVRDTIGFTTTLGSRANGAAGAKGNGSSWSGAISADGQHVAFNSSATNLSPDDPDTIQDMYLRDVQAGTTVLVSRADGPAGAKGDDGSRHPSVSADGRYVAFTSDASNFSDADLDGTHDIFVRDTVAGTTTLANRAAGANGQGAFGQSGYPSISADGTRVAFYSHAKNIAPNTSGADRDVYVRDIDDAVTFWASQNSCGGGLWFGPDLSANGRYVAFGSGCWTPAYVRDLQDSVSYIESRSTAGYPRPQGATPLFAPLVPAYQACGTPNRVHASPLSYGSCNPPARASSFLTTGTPDSNGLASKLTGSVSLRVLAGDATIKTNVTDVRKADLSDYTGELRLRAVLRPTDRQSPRNAGEMPGPATVADVEFGPSIPCGATVDTTIGSTCAIDTTVNALIPGAVAAGSRSNWEFGQIEVYDGGADGDGDTTGDNTPFLRQGIFVP